MSYRVVFTDMLEKCAASVFWGKRVSQAGNQQDAGDKTLRQRQYIPPKYL
jgi:hypothetical protein